MSNPNPLHQKETEWHGEVYFIETGGIPPDDPAFAEHERASKGRPWTAALGFDFDGTIDEAPAFFTELTRTWTGPIYCVTYREDAAKVAADVEKIGLRNVEVVLVNSFAEKADVIKRLNIKVFFDDMDEVLMHIPADVIVFKIRNAGNYCFETQKWLYSSRTGKQK